MTAQTKHPIRIPLQFEPEVFITSGSYFYTSAWNHYKTHGQTCTVPVCKYSPKLSACGSKTCNFDAVSSLTGRAFASVAKVTGMSVS